MSEIDLNPHSIPPAYEYANVKLAYLPVKRLLDAVLSLLFILLASPLFAVIALGIKLYSRGPVFYRQKRVGLHGVEFEMLKFRTMRVDTDAGLHREHVQRLIREDTSPIVTGDKSLKLNADPRITGLGKLLRKVGLDELPQFINVLRGEMSIVGPRPSLPYEYELYNDWQRQRLNVLPGITGLWQVTAHNQVPFSEMVKIDIDYINRMNLWLDLKIMALTPIEMIRGKGGG